MREVRHESEEKSMEEFLKQIEAKKRAIDEDLDKVCQLVTVANFL